MWRIVYPFFRKTKSGKLPSSVTSRCIFSHMWFSGVPTLALSKSGYRSKVIPSSQPVIQAPLLFNCIYNTLILTKMQDKNATSLQLAHNFCFRDESFSACSRQVLYSDSGVVFFKVIMMITETFPVHIFKKADCFGSGCIFKPGIYTCLIQC